jgi:hypothetical protein
MRHGEFSSDPKAVWLTEEGTDDRRMAGLKVRSPAEAAELAEDDQTQSPRSTQSKSLAFAVSANSALNESPRPLPALRRLCRRGSRAR